MIALRLICLFAFSLFWTSCTNESYGEKEAGLKRANEANEAQKQAHLTKLINAFSAKYNADYTWMYGLREKTISTLKLQQSLIRADDRPILAMANILDIENRNGTFRVLFYVPRVGDTVLQRQYLVLDLPCSLSGAEAHTLHVEPSSSTDPDYLLAARIGAIRQAHQFGMAERGSTLAPLAMEYVGEGQCVGLEPIEPTTKDGTAPTNGHPRSSERKPNESPREY